MQVSFVKYWKQFVSQFSSTPWAIIAALASSMGTTLVTVGATTSTTEAVASGEICFLVSIFCVVLLIVGGFLRTRYFRQTLLELRLPSDESVFRKLVGGQNYMCSCGTSMSVDIHLIRLEVRNGFNLVVSGVRLHCHYEGDTSYFLHLRHDNLYRKSDVGELVAPHDSTFFDLAEVWPTVACAARGCNLIHHGGVKFSFADPGLGALLPVLPTNGAPISVTLRASGYHLGGVELPVTMMHGRLIHAGETSFEFGDGSPDEPTARRKPIHQWIRRHSENVKVSPSKPDQG